MKSSPRRRPSVATLLAGLALLVATGGASYAAGTVGTADLKDDAVTSPKVKDGTLGRADLNAATSDALGVGRAYALVDRTIGRDGVTFKLDAKRTYGFVALEVPTEGTFCLVPGKRLDLSRSVVVTTIEYAQSDGVQGDVVWNSATDPEVRSCAAGEVEVLTYSEGDAAGDVSSTDDLAFSVLVS